MVEVPPSSSRLSARPRPGPVLTAAAALACLVPGAWAQEPGPPPPPLDAPEAAPSDPYAALLAKFDAAAEAHKQAIRAERDPAKRRALRAETAERALLPEFEALVKAGDGRGLLWIARHVGAAGLPGDEAKARRAAAWQALAQDHLGAPWVGEALELIKRHRAEIGRDVALGYLEHAHTNAASVEVKACAAHMLSQVFESSEDPKELDRKKALDALLAADYAGTEYMLALAAAARAREAPAGEVRVTPAERAPSEPPPPPPDPGPVVGQFAPSLAGEDVDGGARSAADVEGKVTVVVFFGFWSPVARKALLDLQELERALADPRFTVYGVSAGDSKEKAREWLGKLAITWPVVVQGLADAPLSELWKVRDYPELWVLDAKGRVAGRGKGAELRALVTRELEKLAR